MKNFIFLVALIVLFQLTTIAQNKTVISFRDNYNPVTTTQYEYEEIYAHAFFNKSKIRSYNSGWWLKPSSGFELSINTEDWVRIRKVQIESTIYGWSGLKVNIYNNTFSNKLIGNSKQPKKEHYWNVYVNDLHKGKKYNIEFNSIKVPYGFDWQRTVADKAEVELHKITIYWEKVK